MKRLVLMRFHAALPVCRNRVQLLRLFDPDTAVCGLYGGDEGRFDAVRRALDGTFDDLFCIRERTARWKWQHGDLAVAHWYREAGHRLDFDALHVLESDMLLLDGLDHLYRALPEGAVGLIGLRPLREIEREWSWTTVPQMREEWLRLVAHVREEYGDPGEMLACKAPGACLPRGFLAAYAALDVPALSNDEVRLPLYARALGWEPRDSGLVDLARPGAERAFFFRGWDVEDALIREALRTRGGARVFHPYRKVWDGLVDGNPGYNAWRRLRDRLSLLKRRLTRPSRRGKYQRG